MERQPGAPVPEQPLDPAGRALLERWIYVLVLTGGEFIVPYSRPRMAALEGRGEYEPDFFPFLRRFQDALAGPGWPSGNYFPGGWYRTLKAQGHDVPAVPITPGALGPFFGEEVHVDPRGRWRVGPQPVTGRVLEFFLRHLHFDADLERYFIRYNNVSYPETRYLRHQSPPFRVRAVTFADGAATLLLNDGTREPLRAESLRMDGREALFCAVKSATLPALLEDSARFQVLDRLEERAGGFVLRLNGRQIPLTLAAPWPGADRLPGH
jgi:hypothetical protein